MNCLELATKAAKGRLTEQEILDAFESEQRVRQSIIDSGRSDNLDQRVANRLVRMATEKKIEAARMKRQVAQNIRARAALDLQLKGFLGAGVSPLKAIRALHDGIQTSVEGARKSSDAQGKAYQAAWLGSLFSRIQKERPHILRLMRNRDFDSAVTREMWELREDGNPGSTGNSDAAYLAKQLAAHMELSRTELNRLGAAIGKLDGYAGPQVHDDIAMLTAGRDKWVQQITELLDLDRTFEDASSPQEVADILRGIWDTIVSGTRLSDDSPTLKGQRVGPAGIAKSLGAHRVLHFKNAEAALAYRDLYGRGSTIQGVLGQLNHHAQMAGVMDKFGPNPKVMMLSLAARLQQDLRAKLANTADEKEIASLTKQIDSLNANGEDMGRLAATIDDMTGVSTRPVSTSMAAIGSNIRSVQMMAKLGGAVITSMPSDTMSAAAAAMFRGQGFWNGLFSTIGEMAARKEGKELGFLLGEGFDGIIGHVGNAATAYDSVPGAISKLTEQFFRWNGLSGWTDTVRAASARVIAAHLGSNVGKAFKDLDLSLQHVMRLNGITPQKWELLRSIGTTEFNGTHYLTPDRVRRLSDDQIEGLAKGEIDAARAALLTPREYTLKTGEVKSGRVTDRMKERFESQRTKIIDRARRDLELDLHRYFADETNYAVIETDAVSRRLARGGGFTGSSYRPGTLAGEAIRFIMQFKAFPLAFTNRVLGRALMNAPKGRGHQIAHLGTIMAGLTVAGYMAMTMKDMARGIWPPRNPLRLDPLSDLAPVPVPSTILASMLQGGALGLYGDFLFGTRTRHGQSFLEAASGPALGSVGQLFQIYESARDGDPNAGLMLDFALNNTPFINLFYARPALDYLFINELREAVRPGYLARQRQRLKKERGQDYLLPRRLSEAL